MAISRKWSEGMKLSIFNNYSYGKNIKGSKVIKFDEYPIYEFLYFPEQYASSYTGFERILTNDRSRKII